MSNNLFFELKKRNKIKKTSGFEWQPSYLEEDEWDKDPNTVISIDPSDARKSVERYFAKIDPKILEKYTPEQIESDKQRRTEEKIRARRRALDSFHKEVSDEALREEGLRKIRLERPEMFDKKRIKMQENWRNTYVPVTYHHPFLKPDPDKEISEVLKEYEKSNKGSETLDPNLAGRLSRIIGEFFVGKMIKLSTGSPTLPGTTVNKILDVDPDNQRIVFVDPKFPQFKIVVSYDDFFYHNKWNGISDAQMNINEMGLQVEIPKKNKSWLDMLRVYNPSRKGR